MGEIINIKKYLKERKLKGSRKFVEKPKNSSKFIEFQNKVEIDQCSFNDSESGHFPEVGASLICCSLCDKDFSDTEKIFSEEQISTNEVLFFHEEFFNFYLEHLDEEPDWDAINSFNWPKNICALCEFTFDNNLLFTDGAAYFCEECAGMIPGVHRC